MVWLEKIAAIVNGTAKNRHLLIIAPPGWAKSTYISMVFPAWYLAEHPDQHIGAFTSSDVQAHQFLSTVKNLFEGSVEHADHYPSPSARPDPKRGWSIDGLYLRGCPTLDKDPTYRCVGYGSSIIGARLNGIILDDALTQ